MYYKAHIVHCHVYNEQNEHFKDNVIAKITLFVCLFLIFRPTLERKIQKMSLVIPKSKFQAEKWLKHF